MVAQASRQFRGRPPGWPALLFLPLSPTLRAGRYGLVACKKYVCMYVCIYVCMYVCGRKYVGDAGGGREDTRGRDRLTDGRPKSSSVANRNLLVSLSASQSSSSSIPRFLTHDWVARRS